MKKNIGILLFIFVIISLNAQVYSKKLVYKNYGTFNYEISLDTKIVISSFVTRQDILTHPDYNDAQKNVTTIPKYRYELILISNSIYNKKITKTWIYGAKIFVDGKEISDERFPSGFTAIIEIQPTTIYWFETNKENVDITITWESSTYYKQN
jgi:hypothetical protein